MGRCQRLSLSRFHRCFSTRAGTTKYVPFFVDNIQRLAVLFQHYPRFHNNYHESRRLCGGQSHPRVAFRFSAVTHILTRIHEKGALPSSKIAPSRQTKVFRESACGKRIFFTQDPLSYTFPQALSENVQIINSPRLVVYQRTMCI